jgi:hypothetical protein
MQTIVLHKRCVERVLRAGAFRPKLTLCQVAGSRK